MNVVDPPMLAALAAADADIISLADDRYPPLLRTIYDPPSRLYVRGDAELLRQPQLAVVGARRATAMGLRAAEELSAAAVRAGLHICSGLALGIDGAAHRGAIDGGGRTVAVMATGVETVYPRRHQALGQQILASGCLVTEYPPGTPPRRGNFPRRNRIISGMSLGVLVIEAALPSGSLITANSALEQGREVFALPWSIAHTGGAGCLRLLRDGAKMVLGIDDILQELDSLYGLQLDMLGDMATEDAADDEEPLLLSLLGYEPVEVDVLVSRSGLPVASVMSQLSALEIRGVVVRSTGGYLRV